MSNTRHTIDAPAVTPLMITTLNAEPMMGRPFRWLRELARANGVPVLKVRGKALIPAAPLVEALQREAARNKPAPLTDAEELEAMRAQLRGAA